MKKTVFIIGLCLMASIGFGQLELNAELRPRAEVRHGYKLLPKENAEAATFISQRTRLNMFYTHSKFKVGFSLQDVRIWGDEQLISATGVFGDNASLDLNEGWIEIFAGKSSSFKMGRQYWSYEDERLFAKRNWNQSSIKYDGFLYKFEQEKMKVHVGLSLNNNIENMLGNDFNLYKEVTYFDTVSQTNITVKVPLQGKIKTQNFLYISKKINDQLNVSLQALATGFQKQETANTIYVKGTYGLYVNYKPGKLAIKANGFYQNGKNIKGADVSAYFAHVRGELKLKPVTLNLGGDYHSGQDQTKTDNDYKSTDHFFDLFYGARHKYYGYMDLFDNLANKTYNSSGLVDIYAGAGVKVLKKSVLSLDYHYFRLPVNIKDPKDANKVLDKSLGSEFDFTFEVPIIPEINLTGGLSAFLPTTSMEKLQGFNNGGTGFAYWGWCMITVKPTLFKSEK